MYTRQDMKQSEIIRGLDIDTTNLELAAQQEPLLTDDGELSNQLPTNIFDALQEKLANEDPVIQEEVKFLRYAWKESLSHSLEYRAMGKEMRRILGVFVMSIIAIGLCELAKANNKSTWSIMSATEGTIAILLMGISAAYFLLRMFVSSTNNDSYLQTIKTDRWQRQQHKTDIETLAYVWHFQHLLNGRSFYAIADQALRAHQPTKKKNTPTQNEVDTLLWRIHGK